MRDLVCIQIHSESGVTKERVRRGGRVSERGVLNTKESCSAGVNTRANWDVKGAGRHLVRTPSPSSPAL